MITYGVTNQISSSVWFYIDIFYIDILYRYRYRYGMSVLYEYIYYTCTR